MPKEFSNVFSPLGASNHSQDDRQENDYYATDPEALRLLLKEEMFSKLIWEPCSGGGHLVDELKNHGFTVISSDIIDYGHQDYLLDFLSTDEFNNQDLDIITNPPYKYALQFVKKSLDVVAEGNKVAMFLRLAFLEGQERYTFFKENPPKYVYIMSDRFTCAKNGEFYKDGKKVGSAIAFGWFVWEKGFKGESTLRWLKKSGIESF